MKPMSVYPILMKELGMIIIGIKYYKEKMLKMRKIYLRQALEELMLRNI